MSVRMRLIGWEVRPIIMADDGENLTSVPVNPQTIAAPAWEKFKDGGDEEALSSLRAIVETTPEGESAP